MSYAQYMEIVMGRLSNVLYNGSQTSVTKDQVLDSLVSILNDYKNTTGSNINVTDNRRHAR